MRSIREDLHRYAGTVSWAAFGRTWTLEPAFRYLVVFRLVQAGVRPRLLLRLVLLRAQRRYGIELPADTVVGRGLYIGHFGSITVNGRARLGDNVNLHKGVTIGEVNGSGKRAGVPVIGDRVWIGINALVVGGVVVGDDAVILPGCYVDFDVPAGALVSAPASSCTVGRQFSHLVHNQV